VSLAELERDYQVSRQGTGAVLISLVARGGYLKERP
jgi:hypothetical protein